MQFSKNPVVKDAQLVLVYLGIIYYHLAGISICSTNDLNCPTHGAHVYQATRLSEFLKPIEIELVLMGKKSEAFSEPGNAGGEAVRWSHK